MAPPQFSVRSEYRGPNRKAFSSVGTEGCRAPGNLPRVFGMLNSERETFGGNIPSPTGAIRSPYPGWSSPEKEAALDGVQADAYSSGTVNWARFAPAREILPNFHDASHALVLSPLRGDHYSNNHNLDRYPKKEDNFQYVTEVTKSHFYLGFQE